MNYQNPIEIMQAFFGIVVIFIFIIGMAYGMMWVFDSTFKNDKTKSDGNIQ